MRLRPPILRKFLLVGFLASSFFACPGVEAGEEEDVKTLGQKLDKLVDLPEKIGKLQDSIKELDDKVAALEQKPAAAAAAGVAVAAAAPAESFPTRASTPARKVHFLIFSLTDDPTNKIGLGAAANHAFLVEFARAIRLINPNQPERINIAAQDTTFTEALFNTRVNAIASDITNQDTVFCYISTHGAFDANLGHFLSTSDNSIILRRKIFATLQARGARQTVLITDSCANPASAGTAVGAADVQTLPYPLYSLLFDYAGVMNINGCKPPELSWYLTSSGNEGGGKFTRAFMKAAVEGNATNWEEFFTDLQNRTAAESQLAPATAAQTPTRFNANGQDTQ